MVELKTSNRLVRFGNASLIAWPLIGKPLLVAISLDELTRNGHVPVEMIAVAIADRTIDSLKYEFQDHLHAIPLLGLDAETKCAKNGRQIPIHIQKIKEFPASEPNNLDYLSPFLTQLAGSSPIKTAIEPLCPELFSRNVYAGKHKSYLLTGEFEVNEESLHYLSSHRFVSLDLIQTFVEFPEDARIMDHAICLTTNTEWSNFTFMHLTDIHVAKRYDDLLGIINANLKTSWAKSAVKWYDEKIDKYIKIGREKPGIMDLPLEKRYDNPNNMFRRAIRYANKLAQENQLDFIVMTGDLVDFCLTPENVFSMLDLEYEKTNWVRFLDILLNHPLEPRKGTELTGIEPNEELLVPIFCVPGNHDYRVTHYSLTSLGIYKKLRLKGYEAWNYSDGNPPLAPILTTKEALQGYFQHINPYLDFTLKLGNHTLVFLDSGPDNIKEIKFILMADPSLMGFSELQLQYLKRLAENVFSPSSKGYNFLLSHAPILNPSMKETMQINVRQKLGLMPKFNINDYKESRLRAIGEKDPRSDDDLNYRSGSISNNWKETLDFMTQHKTIALNGHTHKFREFRTTLGSQISELSTGYGAKMTHQYAFYWDDYSELYAQTPELFDSQRPMHFQTPSIGIGNEEVTLEPGAFRIIKIKDNHIVSMNVEYLGDARFPDYWGLK